MHCAHRLDGGEITAMVARWEGGLGVCHSNVLEMRGNEIPNGQMYTSFYYC